MSGLVSSFLTGSNLVIRIGDTQLAYASGISFSDDMATTAIGGIGSYSYDTQEPLQYAARGSMSITKYTTSSLNKVNALGTNAAPARATVTPEADRDGNSLLSRVHFNPRKLILSRTFDIDVYERVNNGSDASDLKLTFKLLDCRLTSYNLTFTQGSSLMENIGFMCIQVLDVAAGQTL